MRHSLAQNCFGGPPTKSSIYKLTCIESWNDSTIESNVKMIQLKTYLNCIDNSGKYTHLASTTTLSSCLSSKKKSSTLSDGSTGAAIVECVKVMRMKRHAKIGTGNCLLRSRTASDGMFRR